MNELYFISYQSAMILSLLISLCIIVLMWQRRQAPGAGAMIVLAASTFVWTLGFLIEANGNTLERQLLFNNIGYLGSMTVPVAWFVFAVNYTSGDRPLTKWRVIPLCIIPIVTVALVWSNDWHHLMWSNEHLTTSGSFIVTAKTYGPFFWGALTYNYILVVAGAAILVRRLFVGTPLYTGQAVSLIVAVSLPLVWNIIYVFDLVPPPRKDLTPVMFAISGIAIALGLMRFRLFTVIPFARKFVIQQLSDGVFVFDIRNRLLEANPAALKMLGADKNIVGKGLEDLSPLSPVLERLSSVKFGRVELPLTVSGKARFYEMETVPMCDNQEQQVGWLTILHDITDLKKMQEQLIMQDRLVSIGQLTSGVAHELNNPLTSVIGFSGLLLQRELPDDIKQDLKTINDEAQRTARIVKNLLTFARKQPQEKQPIDINEGIQRVLDLRAYEQKVNNILVNTRFASDLPEIMADSFQLQQVFLNIIINAEHFMIEAHRRGNLTITTERVDGIIRASFADDGPGIAKENLGHLFDPFFTTKEVGKGTGLGLSICHGIITEHGGKIYAKSKLGKGATFVVELPTSQ